MIYFYLLMVYGVDSLWWLLTMELVMVVGYQLGGAAEERRGKAWRGYGGLVGGLVLAESAMAAYSEVMAQ
ncbi:hypothetical protein RIF29_13489 [Crotalaria pallida]|uniref:Uncharacterized protein n=1 Tax=Crotalaria pallida TaxID=3830 RepID=A0AAN9P1Z5_CROPI